MKGEILRNEILHGKQKDRKFRGKLKLFWNELFISYKGVVV